MDSMDQKMQNSRVFFVQVILLNNLDKKEKNPRIFIGLIWGRPELRGGRLIVITNHLFVSTMVVECPHRFLTQILTPKPNTKFAQGGPSGVRG